MTNSDVKKIVKLLHSQGVPLVKIEKTLIQAERELFNNKVNTIKDIINKNAVTIRTGDEINAGC